VRVRCVTLPGQPWVEAIPDANGIECDDEGRGIVIVRVIDREPPTAWALLDKIGDDEP
jgi:hypothetical protein